MRVKSGIRRWLMAPVVGLLVASTISGTSVDAKSKDTLRIVYAIEPVNMNPVKQANSFGNFWEAISEPLIKQDYAFQLTRDGIITTWTQKTPGVWRFTIRPGLKFTNGEPLDAAAVGFTMTTYRDTVGAPMRAYLTKLQSVNAVSKTVLEATFSGGDLSIPAVLSSVRALPPAYYAQVGHDGFGANPIGSGPYKFKSWTKGVELALERNDDYWGEPAKIKNLVFTFASDGDTRANLLASGAVDFAHPISVQRYASLRNKKTTVVKAADRVQLSLFMMANKTQLSDIRLREAVVRSIDVEPITKNVLLNKGGVPNCSLLLPLLNKPEFPACPKRNLAKAKSLTAQFTNPTITLNYGPARAPADEAVVQAIAAQLREGGFTVNLNPMDYQKMTVDLVTQKLEGLVFYAISPVFPFPSVYSQGFLTTTSITKNCPMPGLDALQAQALGAKFYGGADRNFKAMEKIGITDGFCMIPLYNEIKMWGMSTGLKGFRAPGNNIVKWAELSWK